MFGDGPRGQPLLVAGRIAGAFRRRAVTSGSSACSTSVLHATKTGPTQTLNRNSTTSPSAIV